MDSIRNSHGNLSKLNDLSAQTDTTQKRLDDLIAGLQNGQGTAGKFQALSAELNGLSTDAKQLTTDLNSDHGPSARITKLQTAFDDLGQHFQTALDRMNSGQGTLGLMTVNPQLSKAFANASADFQAVAKGVQDNPRKFLSFTVKLF
jgi:phospholipid/cholesterol/gamma-HCH transport system substrate-binding protein